MSGIHLSLSAYKRRKVEQSKQGRKKERKHDLLQKRWQYGEFKERLRKLLHHSFRMPGMRVLSSTFDLLQLTAEDRRAASPQEQIEKEAWPCTALLLPDVAGYSCSGNTTLTQVPELMCQGQWKLKVFEATFYSPNVKHFWVYHHSMQSLYLVHTYIPNVLILNAKRLPEFSS